MRRVWLYTGIANRQFIPLRSKTLEWLIDQLAITHPLVQISLLSILLENKTLTCRRRDWREGRKPKKGRNSKEKGQRGKSKNGTNVGGFPHISYIQVLVFWGWFNVLWVSACVSLSLREGKKE